jgi:DNA gyrase/topoisomerase IV subunit A
MLLTLQQPEHMQTLRTIAPVAEKRRQIEALISLVTSNYSLKLFEVVEKVKRRLSERNEAVIGLQGDGFLIREPITRVEFENLIRPEYNIIEHQLAETLNASSLRASDIDVVIRTGGSSQIPMFQRLLAQKFGEEKVKAIDTFGSVTSGLGVIAHRVARGEVEKKGYTYSTKVKNEAASGRTNIPPINLDLLKQQIAWQDGAANGAQADGTIGLALLSKNYELTVAEHPAKLLNSNHASALGDLSLPASTLQAAVRANLDERLLLLTSLHRLLLVTPRELIHQRETGIDLARLHGFERGELICMLSRWADIRDHDHLILVSTQGYARRFEMAQIRPTIEGPTPTKLDWTLPGWPRVVLGANSGQTVVLVNSAGRAVRLPVEAVRRTGTRIIQKQKADDIIGGFGVHEDDWLWLLASEGYAKWLRAGQLALSSEGNIQGAVLMRRRGDICGVVQCADRPIQALTSTRLVPLDPQTTPQDEADSLAMHKALKLGKGEVVLGVLQ